MIKRFAALLLCIIHLPILIAQNSEGKYFQSNDHLNAKEYFQQRLEKDNHDIEAIKALIIIAELEKDELTYVKMANDLVSSSWDPFYHYIFENVYKNVEEAANKTDLYPSSIISAKLEIADSLYTERKFEESRQIHRSINQSFNWSIVGPFKNDAGSGFIEKYPPETYAFSPSIEFENSLGMPLEWLKQTEVAPDGVVIFDRYLPNNSAGNVYYANTFFSIEKEGIYDIRIARNCPMKIWLDDDLVYENPNNAFFIWDSSVLKLKLSKGNHRILVKCATYPENIERDYLSFYDSYYSSSMDNHPDNLIFNISFWDLYNRLGIKFALRITEPDKPFQLIGTNSYYDYQYDPANYDVEVQNFDPLEEWEKIESKTIGDYYFLAKAFFIAHMHKEGEAFFATLPDSLNQIVLIKYLKAKFYAANGKNEKAYYTMNDIDGSLTPIFDLTYKKLQALDEVEDEEEYLEVLSDLNRISPSNWKVVNNYIDYFSRKGLSEDRKEYIRKTITTIPEYKERLQKFLEDESYKPDNYIGEKEKNEIAKTALKNIKKKFQVRDYEKVIEFYKNKGKDRKAAALYNELIDIQQFDPLHLLEKGELLYKMEEFEEAATTLKKALKLSPYDPEILETLADVYFDTKQRDTSLVYYRKAKQYTPKNTFSFSYRDIDEKINKIEHSKSVKELFSSQSFKEVMSEYEWKQGYSEEDALVLLYNKNIAITKDNIAEVYQEMMIEIKTGAGAKSWTEADFSFFGNLQTFKVIKTNGSEVIPDESEGYLVFKNLMPGDIIQIQGSFKWPLAYELEGEFAMMNYLNFDAPTYKSRLEVIIPASKNLNIHYNNINTEYEKRSSDGYNYYAWEFNDLTKVEWEEALPDPSDVYASIMVSTMDDWSEVVDWYQRKTYRKLDADYETNAVLKTVITSDMTDEQKVIELYNYITREVNYSYVPFLNSNFIPKSPGHTCSSKIGDCKDVSTLMLTFLRQLGIESYYVLVKTNAMNHQFMLPSLLFDHVIVAYRLGPDDEFRFMDLTTDYYPHYVINEQDAGAWALMIKDDENKIFQLPDDYLDPEKNLHQILIKAEIFDNRNIHLSVNSVGNGLVGGYTRENMNLISEEERKNFILENYGYSVFENLVIRNYDLGQLKEISEPHEMNFDLESYNFIDKTGHQYVFRIPFMKAVLSNPVIHTEKRSNRLNIESILQIDPSEQIVEIKLPTDYRFVEIPEDVIIRSKFGTYELKFQRSGKDLKVSKYQEFTKRIIEKSEFKLFKEYYLNILDADNVKLSIKKV